jgi:hypothetical protein
VVCTGITLTSAARHIPAALHRQLGSMLVAPVLTGMWQARRLARERPLACTVHATWCMMREDV